MLFIITFKCDFSLQVFKTSGLLEASIVAESVVATRICVKFTHTIHPQRLNGIDVTQLFMIIKLKLLKLRNMLI